MLDNHHHDDDDDDNDVSDDVHEETVEITTKINDSYYLHPLMVPFYHVMIALIGQIVVFIAGTTVYKQRPLNMTLAESSLSETLNSTLEKTMEIICAAVAIPLMMDLSFDVVEHIRDKWYMSSTFIQEKHHLTIVVAKEWIIRLMFIASLALPCVILASSPNNEYKSIIFCLTANIKSINMGVMAVLILTDTFDRTQLNYIRSLTVSFLWVIAQVVYFFAICEPPSDSMTSLYWFTVALGSLVVIWYWICASYYMFQITRKIFKHGGITNLTMQEVSFFIYTSALSIINGTLLIILCIHSFQVYNILPIELLAHDITLILYSVITSSLPIRVARYEARKAKNFVLDTKRSVSQTMNSPLHSLKCELDSLLEDDTMNQIDEQGRKRLMSIAVACNAIANSLQDISDRATVDISDQTILQEQKGDDDHASNGSVKDKDSSDTSSKKPKRIGGRPVDLRRMLRYQRKELIDLERFQNGMIDRPRKASCRVSFAENIRAQELHLVTTDGLASTDGNHDGLNAILSKPFHHSLGIDGDDNISIDPDRNDRMNVYQFVQSAALSSITSGDGSHHGKAYKMSVAALQMTHMLNPDRNRRTRIARHTLSNQLFHDQSDKDSNSHHLPKGTEVELKVPKERNNNNNNNNNKDLMPTEVKTMTNESVIPKSKSSQSTSHDHISKIKEPSPSQGNRHVAAMGDDDDDDADTSLEEELMLARINAKKDSVSAHSNADNGGTEIKEQLPLDTVHRLTANLRLLGLRSSSAIGAAAVAAPPPPPTTTKTITTIPTTTTSTTTLPTTAIITTTTEPPPPPPPTTITLPSASIAVLPPPTTRPPPSPSTLPLPPPLASTILRSSSSKSSTSIDSINISDNNSSSSQQLDKSNTLLTQQGQKEVQLIMNLSQSKTATTRDEMRLDDWNEEEGSVDNEIRSSKRPIVKGLKEMVGNGGGKREEIGREKHHMVSSNRDESSMNIGMIMKGAKSHDKANIQNDDGESDDSADLLHMLSDNTALKHGDSFSPSDQPRNLASLAAGSSLGPSSLSNGEKNDHDNNNNNNNNKNDNTLSRLTANLHGALRRR